MTQSAASYFISCQLEQNKQDDVLSRESRMKILLNKPSWAQGNFCEGFSCKCAKTKSLWFKKAPLDYTLLRLSCSWIWKVCPTVFSCVSSSKTCNFKTIGHLWIFMWLLWTYITIVDIFCHFWTYAQTCGHLENLPILIFNTKS